MPAWSGSPLARRPLGLTVNEPLDLQHLVRTERAFREGAHEVPDLFWRTEAWDRQSPLR